MKKILALFGLFSMFALPLTADAITVVEKPMGYVSVNATASKEVVPDTASIYFAVQTTAKDSKEAVDKNKTESSALLLSLKQLLALDKADSIQTKNFILKPNYYTDKSGKKTFQNYTATNVIFVKTQNLENVSKLIDAASKNKATSISDLNFFVENEKKYSQELAREAINNAKIIANLTVSELNQKVSGVKNIRVNVYSANQYQPRAVYANAAKGVSASTKTPVEYGKIKLQANVDADFYVK